MHVAITGASTGIGASLARELARTGADITLVARRRDLLEGLARELPTKSFVVEADLADVEHATDWIAPAEEALGPIDVLVNNAGVQIIAPTASVPFERWEALLRLDLVTPLRLAQAVLPAMLARKSGVIVDVSSMAALAPTPGMNHYNAAKAGLAAASESLRGELRGTGVHVLTVYPGVISTTDMAKKGIAAYGASKAIEYLPRATADELAVEIRRAIERRSDRVIFPKSGVIARWFPGTTRWFLDRFTPAPQPLAV